MKKDILSERQKLLLEVISKCKDELTGQDIYLYLKNTSNSMGLSTVYRNLHHLQNHGLIRCRHLSSGESIYSPVNRDIHHLTCVECGKTRILSRCPIHDIELPPDEKKGFKLVFHTLEFFGYCDNCDHLSP